MYISCVCNDLGAMPATIRDIIQETANDLANIDTLGPERASEELVKLSALLASINSEVVRRQFTYNLLCKQKLEETTVAAQAKILAEATEEWRDWQEGIAFQKATLDMIRALKYFLRNAEIERREATY